MSTQFFPFPAHLLRGEGKKGHLIEKQIDKCDDGWYKGRSIAFLHPDTRDPE